MIEDVSWSVQKKSPKLTGQPIIALQHFTQLNSIRFTLHLFSLPLCIKRSFALCLHHQFVSVNVSCRLLVQQLDILS